MNKIPDRSAGPAILAPKPSLRNMRRRSFLRGMGLVGAGTVLASSGLVDRAQAQGRRLSRGDASILRFLAAAEILETDLWEQYTELGGVQDTEFANAADDGTSRTGFKVTGGNALYTAALKLLDGDMDQYIFDNTDDEISHQQFINAYLAFRGVPGVNLEQFRTLQGSQATGADTSRLRLTNLMDLTVDTSFWTRYRSDADNPDLDPNVSFPQAVTIQHRTAIPRTDADTAGSGLTPDNTQSITDHLKAIAFTAGFHFAFIEQGGTSLYPSLAQRVRDPEVLRILLSIGPVRGDPQHPYSRGSLCLKMIGYERTVHSPERLTHPLIRTGRKAHQRAGTGLDRARRAAHPVALRLVRQPLGYGDPIFRNTFRAEQGRTSQRA